MATVKTTAPADEPAPVQAPYAPAPSDDAATRAVDFYYEHRGLVIGVLVGIVVLAIAIAGFVYFRAQQAEAAEAALVQPALQYGQGDFDAALPGLLEVADEYDSVPAGNLAAFYAGDALFRLGRYDEALAQFDEVDRANDLLGHNAAAGLAATHEQLGNHAQAAGFYLEALDRYDNPALAPTYLLSAARNYNLAGDYDEAREAIETLMDDYADAREAGEAEMLLGRIDAAEAS
jgi:tetratricopeptide (TPR) repeat protein